MARILVADTIAAEGIEILRRAGEVVVAPGLSEEELAARVVGCDALVVRSGAKVTARVLEAGDRLQVVARAGVGVDNVDVAAATRRGVLVVNSPAGNTAAAAEHTVAMMLAACRMIPQANQALKSGRWERSRFTGRQMSGKTLGIVGLGKIGAEVARRARALGMRLCAYDPYITLAQAEALGARIVSLEELLTAADIVTIHTPLTAETRRIIGAAQLSLMKPSAILVNCARGGLVDESALLEALRSGKLSAAALDVFEDEPRPNPELVGLENVVATPHIGASTQEAQVSVAVDVAEQVVEILAGRPPRWPVNTPALSAEALAAIEPFVPLARALGRLQHALLPSALERVELRASADLPAQCLLIVAQHFLVSLLEATTDEPVNYVNVRALAEERGLSVAEGTLGTDRGYSRLLEAVVRGARAMEPEPSNHTSSESVVAGALIRDTDPRLVSVDGFGLDLAPEGPVLFVWNAEPDRPGFVGRFGTLVGEAGVSILGMQVAREIIGGKGLMAASLAQPADRALQERILGLPGVERVVAVEFG